MTDKSRTAPDLNWHSNAAALLKVGVNEFTWTWEIDVLLLGNRRVRLRPKSVLHFGVYYDSPNNSDTWYNVIEVTERRGVPTAEELAGWLYQRGGLPSEEYCVLTMQAGGVLLVLICKEYEIVEFPEESSLSL
jgi:hypothetical protein